MSKEYIAFKGEKFIIEWYFNKKAKVMHWIILKP